ncbi:predicted protein [Plenodomus lingam JN3]|uniref:Predicted protein n=1 Tax=Leptosphaeria maculans (strain JN3 / isolate v23.1.3 / race Av1-4-5-6-7-8) TaxID=985895 RepID=E4ZV49_LEPMJ|nr:predicted protein [Plenodomus lingam JN3]CBX95475.1 predicted protein [Plenodomus lingam JN3]
MREVHCQKTQDARNQELVCFVATLRCIRLLHLLCDIVKSLDCRIVMRLHYLLHLVSEVIFTANISILALPIHQAT